MTERLLNCPFCGPKPDESGEFPQLFKHESDCVIEWSVRCGCCGIEMEGEDREEVLAAWNQRISPCTDEDVERVARAICAARGGDPDECISGYSWEAGEMGRAEAGSVCHQRNWERFAPEARAAISAMNQIRSTDHE